MDAYNDRLLYEIEQFLIFNGANNYFNHFLKSRYQQISNGQIKVILAPIDAALTRLASKTGKSMDQIFVLPEGISILENSLSAKPLPLTDPIQPLNINLPRTPVYTAVNETTYGLKLADLKQLKLVAAKKWNEFSINIIDAIIFMPSQIEKLANAASNPIIDPNPSVQGYKSVVKGSSNLSSIPVEYIIYDGDAQRVSDFESVVRQNQTEGLLTPRSHPIIQARLEYIVQRIEQGGIIDSYAEVERGAQMGSGFSVFRSRDGKSINPLYSKYARQYASSIRHISFTDFKNFLQRTVETFNQNNSDPFVLLTATQGSHKNKSKSNYWATNLAYEYFNPKPRDIVEYSGKTLKANQRNTNLHYVIVDDGAFSGSQITQSLANINENVEYNKREKNLVLNSVKVSIIIPFIASMAIERQQNFLMKFHLLDSIIFYYDTLLEPVSKGLGDVDPKIKRDFDLPAIYFDHKMPDVKSVDLDFLSGMGIRHPDGKFGFIEGCLKTREKEVECPVPPYKKNELA